ncbi:PorP/SprF family type IX secretion system membrane protein [Sediminibacterium ginsengisoli]|uniref:Type IX secretion system membrane protein, PorP/SprF family n=1 Tax=Sediminibacterium ginsengisoli TaxID=413434 RepID=A0A1T4RBU2_9BACT|nr:PorP/SprF family type IX secretion system membrane protein [Sediminibacterium ginsengisoli]SKA13425.1 type IX secretion system membrane protein, PorP/SprF family [Sediminibacterium ginsengisoli]
MKKSFAYPLILLTSILCTCSNTSAQDPVFSQFYASPMSVNPALAGNGDADWRLVGIRRNQWIASGVEPLNTTSLSFDGKLIRQKSNDKNYIGGGLLFLQDYGLGGAYKSNSFNLVLSSHVSLDYEDVNGLSIGLGGTYSNTLIDFNQLTFASQLSSAGFNRTLPTNEPYLSSIKPYYSVFAGITYTYTTETASFDIGIAGYRFMRTNRSALKDPNQLDPPRYNFHADYQTYLGERTAFNANAMYVIESNIQSYTVGMNLGHILEATDDQPTVLNTGLWYRSKEAVIPYLGLMYRNLQGGLTYDINLSANRSTLGNLKTFEFSLILRSPQKRNNPIPCPWK